MANVTNFYKKYNDNTYEIEIVSKDKYKINTLIDNNENLLKLLKENSWHKSGEYIKCSSYNGTGVPVYLHHVICYFYFDEEIIKKLIKSGYIVEHTNNEHNDNRISRLSLCKKAVNEYKGKTLDKIRKTNTENNKFFDYDIKIYNNIKTNKFIIIVIFNKPMFKCGEDWLSKIEYRYFKDNNTYEIVIQDAIILQNFIEKVEPKFLNNKVLRNDEFKFECFYKNLNNENIPIGGIVETSNGFVIRLGIDGDTFCFVNESPPKDI